MSESLRPWAKPHPYAVEVPSAPSSGDPRLTPDVSDHVDEVSLSGADIRGKAASGVLLISLRTFAIRGLGLVGNLVLARLLSPEEFGVLAFGLTLILFGQFFADAGIAAGLIRRNQPPTRHELHAILGFQLLVSSVLMLAIAVVAVPSGRSGQVATVMATSVVVSAWRAPATLLLERRLDYRALAAVEVLEGVIFVTASLAAVALGAGVWGVAGAHVVRAAAGSALMMRKSPVTVLRPTLSMGVVRELLGYGLAVSARDFVVLVRLQVVNLVTAAVAGLPILGLYSLADRIMLVPWVVFGSILRVTFPAMARLVSAGEDTRSDLERGLGLLTVSAGSLLALIAGTAPVLIPSFFGDRWAPAAEALPLIALGLLLAGPIISVGNGYLYAVGDARKVLVSTTAHTVAWLIVAVPLLPSLGVAAVGAGLLAGHVVEGLLLARAVRQRTGLRCYRATSAPLLAIVLSGGVGLLVARGLEPSLLATLEVSLITAALLVVGLFLTARPTVREGFRLAGRAMPLDRLRRRGAAAT